jgi:hypothetical protein
MRQAATAYEKEGKEQCEPSGYHSGVAEDSSLLWCELVQLQTFRWYKVRVNSVTTHPTTRRYIPEKSIPTPTIFIIVRRHEATGGPTGEPTGSIFIKFYI